MRAAMVRGVIQVLHIIPPPTPEWLLLATLVCAAARGCT